MDSSRIIQALIRTFLRPAMQLIEYTYKQASLAAEKRAVAATTINQGIPEVYVPETDSTIQLYNSEKFWSFYPHAFVVQTGTGPDDWAVGGEFVILS